MDAKQRIRLGMRDGLAIYLLSLKRVLSDAALLRWYRKAILKTVMLSAILFIASLGCGVWVIQHYAQNTISNVILTVLLVFGSLYFSATLSALFMNALILVVGGETALRDAFFPGLKEQRVLLIKERGSEILSVVRSLGFALIAVPFLLVPYLIPVAVVIVAYGLGGEALSTAQRLVHEYDGTTTQDRGELGRGAQLGLGLIPSLTAMIPLLGFLFLPVSIVAAIEIQKRNPVG